MRAIRQPASANVCFWCVSLPLVLITLSSLHACMCVCARACVCGVSRRLVGSGGNACRETLGTCGKMCACHVQTCCLLSIGSLSDHRSPDLTLLTQGVSMWVMAHGTPHAQQAKGLHPCRMFALLACTMSAVPPRSPMISNNKDHRALLRSLPTCQPAVSKDVNEYQQCHCVCVCVCVCRCV